MFGCVGKNYRIIVTAASTPNIIFDLRKKCY